MRIERELETIPMDHVFDVDGNEQLCHATGIEVLFGEDKPENWWNEYEDDNGGLHYGR